MAACCGPVWGLLRLLEDYKLVLYLHHLVKHNLNQNAPVSAPLLQDVLGRPVSATMQQSV
jgi:hypothetical protein